jgi:hypothetical protein
MQSQLQHPVETLQRTNREPLATYRLHTCRSVANLWHPRMSASTIFHRRASETDELAVPRALGMAEHNVAEDALKKRGHK